MNKSFFQVDPCAPDGVHCRPRRGYLACKRTLDVLFSFVLLLLLWPVIAALCVAVKADSPGPALFCQTRVGRGRKLFTVYKLRTMTVDAPKLAPLLMQGAHTGVADRESDPRVTRVGRVLRRYSLDELPQLYNVLKGDMSLVGPRPLVQREVNGLPGLTLQRFDVRPGMTGLAQIDCRESADPAERLSRDVYYAQHASFWLDVRILVHTVRCVLFPVRQGKRAPNT